MASTISEYMNKIWPKKGESAEDKPPCKPCMVCSDAKKAKEKCIAEKGEKLCKDLIKAHEDCLVKNGGNAKTGAVTSKVK